MRTHRCRRMSRCRRRASAAAGTQSSVYSGAAEVGERIATESSSRTTRPVVRTQAQRGPRPLPERDRLQQRRQRPRVRRLAATAAPSGSSRSGRPSPAPASPRGPAQMPIARFAHRSAPRRTAIVSSMEIAAARSETSRTGQLLDDRCPSRFFGASAQITHPTRRRPPAVKTLPIPLLGRVAAPRRVARHRTRASNNGGRDRRRSRERRAVGKHRERTEIVGDRPPRRTGRRELDPTAGACDNPTVVAEHARRPEGPEGDDSGPFFFAATSIVRNLGRRANYVSRPACPEICAR